MTVKFLLQNILIQIFVTERLNKYYARSQEKQADIESTVRLNCAQDGIDFVHQLEAIQMRQCENSAILCRSALESVGLPRPNFLNARFFKRILEFLDNHPSNKQRIAYLRPIANSQRPLCTII